MLLLSYGKVWAVKPKKQFLIYGIKFHDVIEPHRNNTLSWLGRISAETPDEDFKRINISGYTEVKNLEHFRLRSKGFNVVVKNVHIMLRS